MLITCVVVVGCKLMMVSIEPGSEIVWILVSTGPGIETIGPGMDTVGPGIDTVGPGTVWVTDMKSVKVRVSVVRETTVDVLIDVVPGTDGC